MRGESGAVCAVSGVFAGGVVSNKKLALIVAEYDHTAMSFNSDGWFNATVAAEKFGKRPNDWLSLPSTIDYLQGLERRYGAVPYVKTARGGNQRTNTRKSGIGGTWLHPKLAVRFAQWLNTDFAIWCDEQIDGLLRGNHPHHDWLRARHEAASSHKVMCAMLKLAREEAGQATAPHHFSNEARLVNWALTGTFQGVDRNALTPAELATLAKLEEHNAVLIGRGVDYRLRKPALETLARALLLKALPGEIG